MSSVQRTSILSKLVTLKFLGGVDGGDLVYSSRSTLKLRCDMSFEYYPADTQTCQYYLRSYSYNASQFFIKWNKWAKYDYGVYLNDPSDSNFDLQVSDVNPDDDRRLYVEEKFDDFRSGNYSALTFIIKARRKLSYHLVQTYIPSVLLIFITWLCFLLPGDMVEARIGISMTTLLTLTAMFATVRQLSPEVSYFMAVDVWMTFCIFFVFLALLNFTISYWIRRKLNIEKDETQLPDDEEVEQEKNIINLLFMRNTKFLVFAIVFLSFMLIYWGWLLTASGYLTWEPNPKYNALDSGDEESDDASNLYKYHEADTDEYAKIAGEELLFETTDIETTESPENLETTTIMSSFTSEETHHFVNESANATVKSSVPEMERSKDESNAHKLMSNSSAISKVLFFNGTL